MATGVHLWRGGRRPNVIGLLVAGSENRLRRRSAALGEIAVLRTARLASSSPKTGSDPVRASSPRKVHPDCYSPPAVVDGVMGVW